MAKDKASDILKAEGPSIVRIGFDPEAVRKLLPDQLDQLLRHHGARLLRGEGSALSEWEHLGLKVDLRPWRRI